MPDYKVLKGYKERNDLARAYRKMRRENPAIARLVWKRAKAAFKYYKDQVTKKLYAKF